MSTLNMTSKSFLVDSLIFKKPEADNPKHSATLPTTHNMALSLLQHPPHFHPSPMQVPRGDVVCCPLCLPPAFFPPLMGHSTLPTAHQPTTPSSKSGIHQPTAFRPTLLPGTLPHPPFGPLVTSSTGSSLQSNPSSSSFSLLSSRTSPSSPSGPVFPSVSPVASLATRGEQHTRESGSSTTGSGAVAAARLRYLGLGKLAKFIFWFFFLIATAFPT